MKGYVAGVDPCIQGGNAVVSICVMRGTDIVEIIEHKGEPKKLDALFEFAVNELREKYKGIPIFCEDGKFRYT